MFPVSSQPRDCPQTKPITSGGGSEQKGGAAMLDPRWVGLGTAFPVPMLLALGLLDSLKPKPSPNPHKK